MRSFYFFKPRIAVAKQSAPVCADPNCAGVILHYCPRLRTRGIHLEGSKILQLAFRIAFEKMDSGGKPDSIRVRGGQMHCVAGESGKLPKSPVLKNTDPVPFGQPDVSRAVPGKA